MHSISYNDITAKLIINPKLKNSYIKVDYNGEVTLKTPYKSKSFALDLLRKRESWIKKQLSKVESYQSFNVNLEDEVLLFGEVISIDMPEVSKLREKLQRVRVTSQKNILKAYDTFYKELAQEYITKRVEYFSSLMQLNYSDIKYKKMKSRWGSCNSQATLTFNSQLIKLDKTLIDYVVVHELSHLVYMNHSKAFHQLVENYLTDAKALRKKLKETHLLT